MPRARTMVVLICVNSNSISQAIFIAAHDFGRFQAARGGSLSRDETGAALDAIGGRAEFCVVPAAL